VSKPAAVPMWKGKPDLYDKLDIDGVSLEARCMVRRWNAEDDERRGLVARATIGLVNTL